MMPSSLSSATDPGPLGARQSHQLSGVQDGERIHALNLPSSRAESRGSRRVSVSETLSHGILSARNDYNLFSTMFRTS